VGMNSVNRHNTWGKRERRRPVRVEERWPSNVSVEKAITRAQWPWMSMTSLQQACGHYSKRAARTQPMCCREGAAPHLDQDVFAWASTSNLSGASDCRNLARPTVLSLMKGDSISDRHSSGTCVCEAHASHRNHTHCDARTGKVPHAGDAATHPNQRLCVTLPLPCAYGHPVLL
jgi:hypothetical protein